MTAIREVSTDEEIGVVVSLANEIWNEHFVRIIGQAQVDYMLEKFQTAKAIAGQIRHGCRYFLVSHGNDDVGYLAVEPDEQAGRMFLSKIYVRRAMRGQGLGKEAVRFVQTMCRKMNIPLLWLTVNKQNRESIAAYERMGFTKRGSSVKDIGSGFVMDDFVMEKHIA